MELAGAAHPAIVGARASIFPTGLEISGFGNAHVTLAGVLGVRCAEKFKMSGEGGRWRWGKPMTLHPPLHTPGGCMHGHRQSFLVGHLWVARSPDQVGYTLS